MKGSKRRNEGSREEFPLAMIESSCAFSLSFRVSQSEQV